MNNPLFQSGTEWVTSYRRTIRVQCVSTPTSDRRKETIMEDLIKRSDAIKTVCECECYSGVDPCPDGEGCYPVNELRRIPSADRPQEWIPCSERLPEDSGDYLVCPSDSVLEDYSDFSDVMIMPYDADCEAFGWWVERYHPISLGYLDSDFNEFEVLAWMPLPEPWKGADDEDN